MQDYQGDDPGKNEFEAFTYSPALYKFEEDDSSNFTLQYQMTAE
ncbi:MAG: hypothetical protein OCC49_04360 [Fibrobacterales bacterium]